MNCDCEMVQVTGRKSRVHGKYSSESPTYRVYIGIRYRCNERVSKESSVTYRKEEKRISKEWSENYERFLEDMGERPSESHSIDREDNERGYCKHNCRWATPFQQAMNRRIVKNKHLPLGVTTHGNRFQFKITISGEEKTLFSGGDTECVLSSYLFQCVENIVHDRETASKIFKSMLDNKFPTLDEYFLEVFDDIL